MQYGRNAQSLEIDVLPQIAYRRQAKECAMRGLGTFGWSRLFPAVSRCAL
jgi:hypothetical protein